MAIDLPLKGIGLTMRSGKLEKGPEKWVFGLRRGRKVEETYVSHRISTVNDQSL